MAKPNTRQFDRMADAARNKLQGVQKREMWALTAGEQAKLASFGTLAFAKATRLKSSPTAERGMERIWTNAEARYRAEIKAAEDAKAKVLAEYATAKAAKKSGGWF
ncbi:hypothetical protein ACIBQ5_37480 [Streptomyces massasporeus]|uniref:hypothetical protein n=1 Tax=Streptomyces massasporeus TaxID=67324 RepID=UPI00379BDF1B